MADLPASSGDRSLTTLTNLTNDALLHCAGFLHSHRDLSNLAMSCKLLKSVAYSDPIWQRLFRNEWPDKVPSVAQFSGLRDAYLARRTAVQQFKFVDPLAASFYTDVMPCNQILVDKSDIILSKGSLIQVLKIGTSSSGSFVTLHDHNARITCMRLFPLNETSLFRSSTQGNESVLVTSSCDRSIRLWWKGHCQRCFRGHTGPVLSLSDKLLGDATSKVFASGGEDNTVRLWSLSSSGKRGQRGLKATFYGHERPIEAMSVAGHKTNLLATISKDSKIRLWDTTTPSAVRSSCCVGMTSVPGAPLGLKCHESLLYVAAGSSVVAIDLRTMQKVTTAAVCQPKVCSFEIMPSKYLICTGGFGKAMLWDIRKSQAILNPEPVAELDGNTGPLTQLHMDSYKIVAGAPEDQCVNVWETDSGQLINSLCCFPGASARFSAMAVDKCRIVTAGCDTDRGLICFRDFNDASLPVAAHEDDHKDGPISKFWETQLDGEVE